MNPEIISALSKQRILVVGDIMLDHYIWGEVNRISPEAPVPIVHVSRESYTAGGAGNVALNAISLGVKSSLIGAIGEDVMGERLASLLRDSRIEMGQCRVDSRCRTIVKTRIVARTQQICRVDWESVSGNYDLMDCPDFEAALEAAVADVDAVIVSDYAKGAVTQALVDRVIELAGKYKVLVALDPKPMRQLTFDRVGLVTPNRHEALVLAGLVEPGFGEPYPLEEVCRRIFERFSPELLVITLGVDGMAVCREGKVDQVLPTEAREVFDVSGAGDTVIAVLTIALAAGASPLEAARLANRAAGIVVSKIGTATVTLGELFKPEQLSS